MIDDSIEDGGTGKGVRNRSVPPKGGASHSLDEILEILSNRIRRELLYFLTRTDDTVVDVETALDGIESRIVERSERPSERDDLRLSLVHVHLPKLIENGLIEYDDRHREFRYRGGSTIEEWLELTRQYER